MHDYQDIPRIFTGIAEITSCFVFSVVRRDEKPDMRMYLKLASAMLMQCLFLYLTRNVHMALWVPCMVVAFLLMYAYLAFNCPLDAISLMYVAFRAFLLAEFAASAEWQLQSFLAEWPGSITRMPWFQAALMAVVYGIVFALAFLLERRLLRGGRRPVYEWSEAVAAGLIAVIVFALSNLGFLLNMPSVEMPRLALFHTRTLIDLGGLAILYAYQFRIDELQTEKELTSLRAGLQVQYENYRNYQEAIELINIKFHDLKHHTMLLRAELDPERRNRHLNELEQELAGFQAEKQTGNRVLDTILAGKSVRIRNSQIQFTCVADGALLDGMHVTDICTLFGNALDNAIEHVAQIEDPSKRIMSMSLARRKDFVYIEVSNYCDREVELQDGLPVTTKKDRRLHGYGVRSMVYAARKYGGSVTFEERNHFFEVKILIPVSGLT